MTNNNIAVVAQAAVAAKVLLTDKVYGNPPFSRKKQWLKRWRFFGVTIALSNGRIRLRPYRDLADIKTGIFLKRLKHNLYEEHGGRCPVCGEHFEFKDMTLHHVLPVGRFPGLFSDPRNVELTCYRCHKNIHNDPYLNIRIMEQKAAELGIDLNEFYLVEN